MHHERGRVEALGGYAWRLCCSCGAEETFVPKIKLHATLAYHEIAGVAHRRLHGWHEKHKAAEAA